jgi:hypothetical protein
VEAGPPKKLVEQELRESVHVPLADEVADLAGEEPRRFAEARSPIDAGGAERAADVIAPSEDTAEGVHVRM